MQKPLKINVFRGFLVAGGGSVAQPYGLREYHFGDALLKETLGRYQ